MALSLVFLWDFALSWLFLGVAYFVNRLLRPVVWLVKGAGKRNAELRRRVAERDGGQGGPIKVDVNVRSTIRVEGPKDLDARVLQ